MLPAASPVTIMRLAPTAAPDKTPIIPGSASGLPNTPCMIAPATASAAPTSTARITRGNRTSHRAASAFACVGATPHSRPTLRHSEPMTSTMGICICPIAAEKSAETTRPTPSTINRIVTRALRGRGRALGSTSNSRTRGNRIGMASIEAVETCLLTAEPPKDQLGKRLRLEPEGPPGCVDPT